jgi:ribosome-associated heat shock protein Hsp15
MDEPSMTRLRVDKWLWAARFYKTRSLASDAVKGGRVQVGGQRVKPSKEIGAGDRVEIAIGQARRTVVVLGVAQRRGPAAEAQLLYEETADSRAEGERLAAQRRLAQPPGADLGARPTKRDRRRFDATPGARRSRG